MYSFIQIPLPYPPLSWFSNIFFWYIRLVQTDMERKQTNLNDDLIIENQALV